MKDNKQPMKVWLAFDAADCFDRYEDCGASDLKNHHHRIGPYVNLEQFMDEVERRLALWKTLEIAGESEPITDKHYKQAALMIAKEIMEGEG